MKVGTIGWERISWFVLALTISSSAVTIFAQSVEWYPDERTPMEKAATLGKNPVWDARDSGARVTSPSSPDVVSLTDGRLLEVWNLKIFRDRVTYETIRHGKSAKISTSKQRVVALHLQTTREEYLRKVGPPEGVAPVTDRDRQPVQHREILAGSFGARQGKFTDWSFSFTSQVNRYFDHVTNATEYGTFVLRNRMSQPTEEGLHENKVTARGKYFLYAPGVFGNKDWILNLTNVSYTELNRRPRKSIYTDRLTDEVFILKLSRDENIFQLQWANQPGWQWTSPTQQTFYRVPTREELQAANVRHKALELLFPSEDEHPDIPTMARTK